MISSYKRLVLTCYVMSYDIKMYSVCHKAVKGLANVTTFSNSVSFGDYKERRLEGRKRSTS